MGLKRLRVKTPGTAAFLVRSSVCIFGLLATFSRPVCEAFNLDVENPAVYSGPEGSNFGYAVDFYLSKSASASVVIGAPKANTSQSKVIEGGSVFYCPWSATRSDCHSIEFDPEGDRTTLLNNTQQQVDFKSHQWFGATVRSHGDTILACALFTTGGLKRTYPILMLREPATSQFRTSPNLWSMLLSDSGPEGQGYCQGGFSADFTTDGRVVLGGPGSYFWQGQVISAAKEDIINAYYPGYFMQAVEGQVQTKQVQAAQDDSYQGYSVAVGEFSGDQIEDFVAGVPKGLLLYGLVTILNGSDLTTIMNFTGEQMGSYYGYALATTDINSDGMVDLLVGAPMFMVRGSDGRLEEMGRVYVYLQRSPLNLEIQKPNLTGSEVFGRFGSTIAPLGDLNQDGFNDVAISCPFGGDDKQGLVYIYNGYSEGLREKPSQVIVGQWAAGAFPASFGFALRGAQDLDMNGYPDLIVGAFGVNKAVLYRSRPIVSTSVSLTVSPSMINPEEKACMITNGNSSIHVSCVNLSYCISADGKHLPAELDFQVEVKLDSHKHKQKGAVKRALFLDSQQPLLQKRMRVRHGARLCDHTKIYLRDEKEFRDKLSSIFVALNFSLDPEAAADSHGLRPILNYKTTNVIEQKAQILLDCGEDNICVPDLKLTVHSDRKEVYLGDDNSLTLTFNARNEGEGGAYEAELYVALPLRQITAVLPVTMRASLSSPAAMRLRTRPGISAVIWATPMKAGTNLWAGLRFTVPRLKDTHKTVQFYLQIRSKNENNSQSEVVYYNPEVVVQADVILHGVSRPDKVFFPPANWKVPKTDGAEQDVGPAVEHIYELVNNGPSRISGTSLELRCPLVIQGHSLLYPLQFSTEGPVNCTADKSLNHLKLRLQSTSTESPVLALRADEHHVEKRNVQKNQLADLTNLSCSNAECWKLQCNVGLLEKGTTAILKMRSRVWAKTFTERAYKQYVLECLAEFKVMKMPYAIPPKHYPSGQKKVVTPVVWNKPDIENSVPLWIIVLAILAGLLLLALLIYVLYRFGFFKRSLPYGTAMEKAQLKPQAASEA